MPFAKGNKLRSPASGRKKLPPDHVDVQTLARQYTREAVEKLVQIMRTGENERAAMMAAEALLNRGHGKAAQTLNIAQAPEPIQGPCYDTISQRLAASLVGRASPANKADTLQ